MFEIRTWAEELASTRLAETQGLFRVVHECSTAGRTGHPAEAGPVAQAADG